MLNMHFSSRQDCPQRWFQLHDHWYFTVGEDYGFEFPILCWQAYRYILGYPCCPGDTAKLAEPVQSDAAP